MRCPFCGNDEDRVLESRGSQGGAAVRRRRECSSCQRRYTTYEQIELPLVLVVKRNGQREVLDRVKLLNGMVIACRKRPVPIERLDEAVNSIEQAIHDQGLREIDSLALGEMVAEELRKIDHVAFVRFASVYRQFEDVEQFKDILEGLDTTKLRV